MKNKFEDDSETLDDSILSDEVLYILNDAFTGKVEDKPITEQELFSLQKKYLITRNLDIWREMLGICRSYARSLLLKRRIGKSKIELDKVEEYATSVAVVFMRQYLFNKDFVVGASFAGMMGPKILEVLYSKKDTKEDSAISLNSILFDENKGELCDIMSNEDSLFYTENFDKMPVEDFYKVVNFLFEEFKEEEPELYFNLLIRHYLILFIRNPKNNYFNSNFLTNVCKKDIKADKLCELFLLELRNRVAEESMY